MIFLFIQHLQTFSYYCHVSNVFNVLKLLFERFYIYVKFYPTSIYDYLSPNNGIYVYRFVAYKIYDIAAARRVVRAVHVGAV